jgi:DNA (cytosine-5)-methyltransferase 1
VKPRLLDLFCGAGGAAKGYHRAGFDVVGVDNREQPRYPFPFVQDDALECLAEFASEFDVVHASPPCQAYSTSTRDKSRHPALIPELRALLTATGLPYVIENVPGAPLQAPMLLCGHAFGLPVRRHRLFESNIAMLSPGCFCDSDEPIGIYGDHPEELTHRRPDGTRRGRKARTLTEARQAVGIDWMTWPELKEAIPPAYTQFVGQQLLAYLEVSRV